MSSSSPSLSVRVWCLTWNQNNRDSTPSPPHLSSSLCPPGHDLYCYGVQEGDPSVARWENLLASTLTDCVLVKSAAVGPTRICVFAERTIASRISRSHVGSLSTGLLGGSIKNKGGVAVALDLDGTKFCFVSAHFQAHHGNCEKRNEDYRRISSALFHDLEWRNEDEPHAPSSTVHRRFDRLFWVGDLNYRLEGNRRVVEALIESRQMEVLRALDQLNRERSLGRVFKGWLEGPVTFLPTYKFDPGTDVYDTSAKARVPSFTDRILWHGHGVTQLSYSSLPQLSTSDHKPVFALFEVLLKQPWDTTDTDWDGWEDEVIGVPAEVKPMPLKEAINSESLPPGLSYSPPPNMSNQSKACVLS
jgi:hypothetical protein